MGGQSREREGRDRDRKEGRVGERTERERGEKTRERGCGCGGCPRLVVSYDITTITAH